MKAEWKRRLTEIAIWLIAEIILNLLGIDNLVDCSEFIFKRKGVVASALLKPVMVVIAIK